MSAYSPADIPLIKEYSRALKSCRDLEAFMILRELGLSPACASALLAEDIRGVEKRRQTEARRCRIGLGARARPRRRGNP